MNKEKIKNYNKTYYEKHKKEILAKRESRREEMRDYSRRHYAKQKEDIKKLQEAKEMIRDFIEWANWQGNGKCPSFKSIQDKAEQFLKEE